jgi:hypothetical protein
MKQSKAGKKPSQEKQRLIDALKIAAAAYDDLAIAYKKAGWEGAAIRASGEAARLRSQAEFVTDNT